MHLVAKVYNLDITEKEVLEESQQLIGQDTCLAEVQALNRLIDRHLLFHQALLSGLSATEEEFETALMETLEDIDDAPQDNEQTKLMEDRIRSQIIIRKYIQQLCAWDAHLAEDKLFAFYEDQKEVFLASEAVHASHLLIRADEPDALEKIKQLRARILTSDDFTSICAAHSQCPSVLRCEDLGWFPKGRMIKEIEDVAFSLEPGQISDVFRSRYGYHILMVNEVKNQQQIAYEDIKDSLQAHLTQLEKEFFLIKHVNDLRASSRDQIKILDQRYLYKVTD